MHFLLSDARRKYSDHESLTFQDCSGINSKLLLSCKRGYD